MRTPDGCTSVDCNDGRNRNKDNYNDEVKQYLLMLQILFYSIISQFQLSLGLLIW